MRFIPPRSRKYVAPILILIFMFLISTPLWSDTGSEYNNAYRILRNGKWGAVDSAGEVILEPEYDYVFPFVNGITVVRKGEYQGGKRAYFSSEGEFVTSFEYDRAYYFFGDLAVAEKNGKEGYLARDGGEVTEFEFDFAYDMRADYAPVLYGTWQDGKWGLLDSGGTIAIEPQYQAIRGTASDEAFIVKSSTKYGLVGSNGENRTGMIFDNMYSSGGKVIGIRLDGGEQRFSVLELDGTEILRPQHQQANVQIRYIAGNNAVIFHLNKFGLIDLRGNELIEPKYDGIWVSSDRVITVASGSGRNRRYGTVGYDGTAVLTPQLQWLSSFDENGIAIYYNDGKYGVIGESGEFITRSIYDSIRPFSEGLAAVNIGGMWGFIDQQGRIVIDIAFDWVYDFVEDMAVFRVGDWDGGKRGYLDKSGNIAIQPLFDWAYSFDEGVAYVAFGRHYDGTFGYINRKGEYISEPSN